MNTGTCELCSAQTQLANYALAPLGLNGSIQNAVSACAECRQQLENPETLVPNHWRRLQENIWTENPAVKIIAWRVLTRLSTEGWAQELLHQLDLDDDLLKWAKSGATDTSNNNQRELTRDSNGAILKQGDSVTLIKDLEVKGANFTAKRGTLVKNITLTEDVALIEGRVNGTQIVLKTCFLKKV